MTTRIPARVAADAAEATQTLADLAAAVAPAPAANEPAPAPAPEPVPEPAPPPAPVVQPVDLHRELQRVQQQLNTQNGRLEQALANNQQLQSQLLERPAAPAQPPAPPPSLITDKEREDYGDELIGLIGRVVAQTLGSRLDDVVAKVNTLEGRMARVDSSVQTVAQTTRQTANDRYLQQLDTAMPGWDTVNEESEFLDWLEKVDTLSGKKYGDLLQDAHQQMDAARVTSIFCTYKPELRASAPPPSGTQPTNPELVPIIDPMTLAAPNTAPAAPAPAAPPAGRIWTQADIDKLYDDKMKKRITQETFDQREAEYLQAMAEGRVSTT